ncbi:MAG: PilZ domain-containing protein, partial [Bdellovibrionota bacterium]
EQIPLKKKDGQNDERANPRFLLNLKVFINVEGRVITNTTVNISVGGMKLRHALPADLGGSFDVTLIRGNLELSMRCRAMKNAEEKEVTRLLIEHCNRLDVLRTWLVRDSSEAAG